MKNFKSPVYEVRAIEIERIKSNAYNPNKVANPELKLLYQSIKEDGYTMPIVCYEMEDGTFEIVDGFHRYSVMKKYKDIYKREDGKLPVVVIDKPISERMASTIRHNRARGVHSVELMSEIVGCLIKEKSGEWILKNVGMCSDELLRFKQLRAVSEEFKHQEFSQAWEI